ncbi:tyrosine-type recombinase/integrase [Nocardia terpenica]|uniref:Tyrosine-type recombinase/integrase n=1 Tax=Nocardia terpenica TaxID=455432 RepID=A0A6G9Z0W5_9NOCA|nr:tyrosine-type recombinase/integrase [Nocardia terpenica]
MRRGPPRHGDHPLVRRYRLSPRRTRAAPGRRCRFHREHGDSPGKGAPASYRPFGDKTRTALRRYLRIRARHPKAINDEPALKLGKFGPMTDHGIGQLIERRCQAAGIDHIHPHQFRHFFAHDWLDNGGQEQDLMMLAGWRSRQMLAKYGKSVADERAKAAHRRARLGDQI